MSICARRCSWGMLAAGVMWIGGVAGVSGARADSIAVWNFNQDTLATTGGTEAATATLAFTGAVIGFGGGSAVNLTDTTVAGDGVLILAGAAEQNNGKSFLFTLSMTDYQSLVVTYATDRSNQGFKTQTWKYSTDGSNFTSLLPAVSPTTSYALATVNFSGITALNDAPAVYLELTLGGATSTSEGGQFDNFAFSATSTLVPNGSVATPLPSGAAVGGVGLVGAALAGWRRRRAGC